MAMTIVVSGKMYSGAVYSWVQNQGKEDEKERQLFRGRLNYRDRTNGEWYWIDAVCFNDLGANGGLVGFLEEHFLAENGPKETGGQPIEIVGYLRPAQKLMTVPVINKKTGKTIEIPNVAYNTFELVIERADFPPRVEGEGTRKSNRPELDFDDLDDDFSADDFEVVSDDEEDIVDDTDASDDKPLEEKSSKEKKLSTKKTKKKEESATENDDADEFFNS